MDSTGFDVINETYEEQKSDDSGSLIGSDDLGIFDSSVPAAYTCSTALLEFKITSIIFTKDFAKVQLNRT